MVDNAINIDSFYIYLNENRLFVRRFYHEIDENEKKLILRPVVVMLHEALGCVSMLRDIPETIAKLTGCDVLAYDRLGHGKSDCLPNSHVHEQYMFDEAWKFLPNVLDICGIQKALLWGHSDGGTMALLFAGRFTERVTGVITEAAHVFVDLLTIKGIETTIDAWKETDLKKKLEKYHGANINKIFNRWTKVWLSESFFSWNIEMYLADIKVPVLVIQGAVDQYGLPEQMYSIAEKVTGDSKMVLIPHCGHAPHIQARKVVLQEILDFTNKYYPFYL
ncbi:Pimeloyl-ACP methyl ester carboxylesterase [Desulfocicer vacuolatum DSM 3385]|uniref:Pimeloyl-ACP methyl ester carboxylesterase n=1 Tax=Desulfocicer vacuolatum DSM 3385 TaxID=1121400 RepID=A0A1W2BJI4_9BACT|nr:alpha/beta hydrolase [Desulfocicer vacuolatum]SMC72678.1 Pimeloyl-ACP methyl ester carboxylesterase [Desulfocicer vacuolatum DSM 3385]